MAEAMPRMAAVLMPRELSCWGFTALSLGALEGGLMGVIVKTQFQGVTSPGLENLAVAVVAGAPAFTNLASFAFASFAQGRDKLGILHRMIQLMGLCLLLMAAVRVSAGGLVLFCTAAVLARTAWTGILTMRAAVWRANYRREWRARVTARIVQLSSLLVAASAALCGWLLEWRPGALSLAFIVAGASAFVAAWFYRHTRVRRQSVLLSAELAERAQDGRRVSLGMFRSVLGGDRDFRNYMIGMMVFGSGNLMLIPLLVVTLAEHLDIAPLRQVLVTSSIPLLVLIVSVPQWARLLDRHHIFGYRAIQSWFYLATNVLFAAAVISGQGWLLWPAAAMLGCANAGGHLGWNLGHNDFTGDARAAHYMAVHVTLTGLRGLVMPVLGIACYEWLGSISPGAAPWAMLLPVTLTLAGCLIFVQLHRQRARAVA